MKFCIQFFLLIIVIRPVAFAQNSHKIDSLNYVLKNAKHDTTIVSTILQIGEQFLNSDPDTSIQILRNALVKIPTYSDKDSIYFSLEAKIYMKMGIAFKNKGQYEKAMTYYKKSLQLYRSKKNKTGLISCYLNIGNVHKLKGSNDNALDFFNKTLLLAEQIDDKKSITKCLNNIGDLYSGTGDYTQAIQYFQKSLRIREIINDQPGIAGCYMNIGKLHETQKNYSQAIDYLKKSQSIYESLDDKINTAYCLNNIGSIHSNMKQYKEALESLKKALNIFEKLKDKKATATCLANIGSTLANFDKQDESFEYFKKAYDLSNEIGDNGSKAFSLINIGAYYNLKNDYSKGIEYCNKGLSVAKKINQLELQKFALEILFELYSKQGDFKNAFTYHVQYKNINDSIYNAEKTKQITDVEAKYQNEKKQLIIKNQTSELARKSEQMQKQKIVIIAAIAVIILVLIFSVVLYRLFRQKKLINILLERKNIEVQKLFEAVSLKNKKIEKQKEEIDDSIRYAQRIQQAILPKHEIISEILEDYFILFKPKDVVSGDFYFVSNINKWLIVAVADCTGHGVPGGFMSMLGLSFLNEIVNKSDITETSQVLNEMREYIIRSLKQKGSYGDQKDGMDITIIAIDMETNKMMFSGANNSLYLTRKNYIGSTDTAIKIKLYENSDNITLLEFLPDKMPVAIYEDMPSFTMHEFTLQKGDNLYFFSDGYQDQFGGPKRKKFLSKQFRELIMNICIQPMCEQKEILNTTIEDWKGEQEQIDDITVMGIRI